MVSLLDAKSRKEGHEIWISLHNKFPDDALSLLLLRANNA